MDDGKERYVSHHIKSHWKSYGELNNPRTWVKSLILAAAFLLIVYILTGYVN
jgi:hypothetical protein